MKNAKVDHVAKLAIPLTVGAEVPRNLHFYPFPKEVAEIAPEYGSYFYVVAAEKIVVIDPLKLPDCRYFAGLKGNHAATGTAH